MLINQVTLVLGVFQMFCTEDNNAGKIMNSITLGEKLRKFVSSLIQYLLNS